MPVCARVGRSGLHARRPTRDAGVTKVAEAQTAALGRGWGREQRGFGGGGAYRAAGICMDGGAAVVAGRGEQRWR